MSVGVFVTGTDTAVGKTWVAAALLRELVASGFSAVGMKPVAAGAAPGVAEADDVVQLREAGNVDAALADRNPYAFVPAMAPHAAAARAGVTILPERIAAAYAVLAAASDVVVVEGAGGAMVPIDARHDMLDIAQRLALPVLLVVGVRLGCINHALLSAVAIRARGLCLAGWVANRIDPAMADPDASIEAVAVRLAAPLLGDFRWQDRAPRFAPATHAALGLPRERLAAP